MWRRVFCVDAVTDHRPEGRWLCFSRLEAGGIIVFAGDSIRDFISRFEPRQKWGEKSSRFDLVRKDPS